MGNLNVQKCTECINMQKYKKFARYLLPITFKWSKKYWLKFYFLLGFLIYH